jgi:hypothetical protein
VTGEQSMTLDGSEKPTEICLLAGAIVHLTVTVPAGQTWSAPTVDDTSLVGVRDAKGGSGHVSITLRAISGGTARVNVSRDGAVVWTLLVAVGS